MRRLLVGWFELNRKDGPARQSFYSTLVDWEVSGSGSGCGLVAAGESGIGGGNRASAEGGDGGVTLHVEVDDPARFLNKTEKLGGTIVVPPTEVSDVGLTFAQFANPEGHVAGLSKGAVQ